MALRFDFSLTETIESNALHPSYKSSVLKRVQLVLAVSRLEAWQRVSQDISFCRGTLLPRRVATITYLANMPLWNTLQT